MRSKHKHYNDQPTTQDELGFNAAVEALSSIITGSELADTPLTIGIFGSWGSGKTSLMQMILEQLDPANGDSIPIWFDAWRYARQDEAIWRALLLGVTEGLRDQLVEKEAILRATLHAEREPSTQEIGEAQSKLNQELDDLVSSLHRSVEREETGALEVNWTEAAKLGTRLGVRLGLSFIPAIGVISNAVNAAQQKLGEGEDISSILGVIQREKSRIYRDQVTSLDQFQNRLRKLIKEWITGRGRRLVIFIDDLDRCLPEQALSVLEAIRIFLDIQGCIFILGVDRTVIEMGLRLRYSSHFTKNTTFNELRQSLTTPMDGRDYLERIVQIPFELPPLKRTVVEKFINKRLQSMKPLNKRTATTISRIMSTGILPNPRKVKRTINTFRLLLALSHAQDQDPSPEHLAKIVVIQSSYPHIYSVIIKDPASICLLEAIAEEKASSMEAVDLLNVAFSGDDNTRQEIHTLLQGVKAGNQQEQQGISISLSKILQQGAPLLKEMLLLKPNFSSLDSSTLEYLVFLTRTTQSSPFTNTVDVVAEYIGEQTIASFGDYHITERKYRFKPSHDMEQ
jgi:hypothetical protein